MLCLAFGAIQLSNAQTDFGIKGGVNYNSNSIKESKNDLAEGGENKTGYHAGIWFRVKVPVLGLYVRPEVVYTNLENEIKLTPSSNVTAFTIQKIDVPVLLGKKIFGVGNLFVGPSFQYIIESGTNVETISNVDSDDFTVGIQFGGGVEFGSFGVDVRWERGLSDFKSSIASANSDLNVDTRINQVIIGLSIKF